MASLGEFLRGLFEEGRVAFRSRPVPAPGDRDGALAVLAREFEAHRLDVAGPPIRFDPASALASAELARQSCWFAVSRSEPAEELGRRLVVPPPPRSASEHLSADLSFRFLPTVHRRARAIAPDDRLAATLAGVFRAWPLSGVLSDVEEGPDDLGGFGGHPGLLMLYAERLAGHERPGWVPAGGLAREHVDRVFEGLGRPRPAPGLQGVSLG